MELNKIYCEDCLNTMKRMPDNFVDLTVTSPPYDNLRDYKGYNFDFKSIAKELFRVTKNGGVVVWVVADATINGSETGTSFKQALYFIECGFNLHDTMIYTSSGMPKSVTTRYQSNFEYMFILSKGKIKTFNPIKTRALHFTSKKEYSTYRNMDKLERKKVDLNEFVVKSNVWKYATGLYGSTADKIAFNHQAIFPEKLARDHIYSWSNENDLVYDPFVGSGTTAKEAHLLKRNWIVSEISKEYCDLTNKRLEPYLTQTTLNLRLC